ncbi:MAG: M67 family metallopeptidase [Parasphingorhabdus sp.]
MLEELQKAAKDAAPEECCGLLFGDDGRVSDYELTTNIAHAPEQHFEIDPVSLISAEREMRGKGPAILGYFHSHPTGDVNPSETDAKSAAPDDRIWLILNGNDSVAWRAVQDGQIFGRFDPILLECINA